MEEQINVSELKNDQDQSNKYQVLITDVKWNKDTIKSYKTKKDNESLPDSFTLDLPMNVLNQAKKKNNVFNDVVETFVYNFLTRKFGHEVYHCSIWLPLEDDVSSKEQG